MISEKMAVKVKGSSVIRAMFEEGQRLSKLYGPENVYDFSIGNPNVAPPGSISEAIVDVVNTTDPLKLHGYMSNAGYEEVREAVADSLNKRFGTDYNMQNIVMTVGAAGGLNALFRAILNPGDEVIAFAPFFGEYREYVDNYDGNLVVISPDTETFQPKLTEFESKITPRTKAVIVNSPNNPSGVIYSADTYKKMAEILERKNKEYGIAIYLVTDEPYRELAFGGAKVEYVPDFYDNTIVGYSFSKSLSLPGERIGYLVVPSTVDDYENLYAALGVATRVLGYVNAPSLMQLAVSRCLEETTDLAYYERNRDTLYKGLTEIGYTAPKPEGAFYLFMKSPLEDEKQFVAMAKKYNILIVPGSSFACPGYVRIAYCVAYEKIVNALPKFKELWDEVHK